ncbi:efflux RND transporter periplasmic adaptor subunit [Paenibacillus antri]|uniref:Efflux RND transporter periplasmic adaptor subunit n=1 Tax=Paenibacillus antri TaxID=2582848 RepID=A0A5R9G8N6_9BACL|nr:efflux RND transporter periplasmic adaptor subunit [Paenibacillus antri]TLS50460.1 efflux RND transporter periplasmic adaptor subunit [Paenibacillus antri]
MFMRWWTDASRRPNRSARVAFALTLAAALAVTSGCSLLPKEAEEEVLPTITPPKLSEKPTYDVRVETIEQKVQGIGKIMSLREENLFFTSSGETGGAGSFRVKEVYVKSGETVAAGDLIAVLDVAEKERELRRQKLEFRQEELKMIDILRKADEYEPEELEQLKVDFELKRTTLVELEETIANAQLTAPFDGSVVSLKVKAGDTVAAYDTIAVLADLSELAVAVDFSRDDLNKVAVGMDAVVSISAAGEHKGKVERLPTAEEDNNNGNPNPNQPEEDSVDNYLLVELESWPEGVTRGTPLSVTVVTDRIEQAVVIPPAALRSYNGRSYVQVVDGEGNKAEVDVEVGKQTSTQVQIVKGLEPGQKVVGR